MILRNLIVQVLTILFFHGFSFASWSVWTEPLLINKVTPAYNPGNKSSSIVIKGARNEWVCFQVCVRSLGEDASNFVPSIRKTLGNDNYQISKSNFIFYLVNYHNLDSNEITYGRPDDWPDACVPYRDRWYNEKRNGKGAGWGQVVPSGKTQIFLVELFIPPTAKAGNYIGTIRITADGSLSGPGNLTQDITINLTVWNFTLPEQWSLTNLWGVAAGYWAFDNAALGGRDDAKAREWLYRLAQSGLDHGVWFYSASNRYSEAVKGKIPDFTDSNFTGPYSWKKFLDAKASSDYNPKPYPRTSIFCTRSSEGYVSWKQDATYLDNWASWISKNGYNPYTVFADKWVDEPSTISDADIAKHARRHSGYPARPFEYYTADKPAVYPPNVPGLWESKYKQLWCVKDVFAFYRPFNRGRPFGNPNDFEYRKSTYGDILWLYFAGASDRGCYNYPGTRIAGSPMIDAYSRQNAFIALECWKFKASGIHHWLINYNWKRSTDQVWEDVSPFAPHYNGDGMWYYPGRPSGSKYHIGGIHEIPIESLRLKLFRWGAQTYEYCKLLQNEGKSSIADEQVANMITFNYPNTITIHDVRKWETARETMANGILGGPGSHLLGPRKD